MLLSSLSILMGAVLVPSDYLWLYSTHIILTCLYLIASKRLIVLFFTFLSLISVYINEFNQESFSIPLNIGQKVSLNPNARILVIDPSHPPLAWKKFIENQKISISFLNLQGNRQIITDVSMVFSKLNSADFMAGEITQITLPNKAGLWWQRHLYIKRQTAQIGIKFNLKTMALQQQQTRQRSSIRERGVNLLNTHFASFPSWRFSKALLVGSNDLWSERDTWMIRTLGLAHLFVVSGLHVGFVFALGGLFSRLLWKLMPKHFLLLGVTRWLLDASLVIPILVFYCYVTGWGEPVVRATIMLSTYLLAKVFGIKVSVYGVITFALWLVLLIDPRAILQASLWLSFSMVYLLIGFFQTSTHWTRLVALQLMLSTASMVLVLGWQEAISSAAIPINLILIPTTAFVWFPLGVLACVEALIIGTSYCYALLDGLLHYLIAFIELLAFTAPLFFFARFTSFIPQFAMLLLLGYWVFQTPLKRGVFAVCGIWLTLFSVASFRFSYPDLILSNQGGELVLKNEQGILLSAQWAGKQLEKLSINSYIKGNYRKNMALSANKGSDWSPRDLLENHVDWLFVQDQTTNKTTAFLQALQVNWLVLLPNDSLAFYFHDGRILLRHSSCIFSFFVFKSDTCKRVEKLESMLN